MAITVSRDRWRKGVTPRSEMANIVGSRLQMHVVDIDIALGDALDFSSVSHAITNPVRTILGVVRIGGSILANVDWLEGELRLQDPSSANKTGDYLAKTQVTTQAETLSILVIGVGNGTAAGANTDPI